MLGEGWGRQGEKRTKEGAKKGGILKIISNVQTKGIVKTSRLTWGYL